jgi:hypothetical protein
MGFNSAFKGLNIKFHENPSRWKQVVPCGRTGGQEDGHYEVNIRFPQFCDRA